MIAASKAARSTTFCGSTTMMKRHTLPVLHIMSSKTTSRCNRVSCVSYTSYSSSPPSPQQQQPLAGLKVLDLSRILAGPFATMLLGDAGAHVIKCERPGTGDDTRTWGPPFLPLVAETSSDDDDDDTTTSEDSKISTYFLSVNRNKRSVAVDLKHEQGRGIVYRLATEWADVVIENFKLGTMETTLGLDYDNDLSRANPGLIYCRITGFGPTGPYARHPGYDVVVSGMYGLMSITGDEDGDPAKVGVAMTDVMTGTLAYGGIVSALHARDNAATGSGRGQRVDVSLMETQLASLVNIASSSLNSAPGAPPPKRWGTSHESIVPYQAFQCKSVVTAEEGGDGNETTPDQTQQRQYVVVGAGNDQQFETFCQVLGMPELVRDERYRTNAGRVQHRSSLIPILEDIFKQKTRDEWIRLLEGKGFPLGPVRNVAESFDCPQATARGMVEEWEHPDIAGDGKFKLPRTPITYTPQSQFLSSQPDPDPMMKDGDPTGRRRPPPMLGEHTEEILRDVLGMDDDKINQLEGAGVVECWRRRRRRRR